MTLLFYTNVCQCEYTVKCTASPSTLAKQCCKSVADIHASHILKIAIIYEQSAYFKEALGKEKSGDLTQHVD
jgi:hypothetical protein